MNKGSESGVAVDYGWGSGDGFHFMIGLGDLSDDEEADADAWGFDL